MFANIEKMSDIENNENMNVNMSPEKIEKLCEEVREKDLILLDLDLQIEWYENSIAESDRENAERTRQIKEIDEQNKDEDGQIEQSQFFYRSEWKSREMEQVALSAFHALAEYKAEEENSMKLEALKEKEELDSIYMEAEKRLTDNPLYKEMEQARAKALIADMKTRQLEVAIAVRKSIRAEEERIKKIVIDQYCLVQRMEERLEYLKAEESEKMKKLLKLQEEEKLGKVKMMNITHETGNQDLDKIEQGANSSGMREAVLPPKMLQQTKEKEWDTSKLHLLLKQEAPKQFVAPHVIPKKVRILNENIIFPASVSSPEPEKKRKMRQIELSKNWLKNDTCSIVSEPLTQESEANSSAEISQISLDTSQESQCSLKDRFMKQNTPENISLFKKPTPFPQLPKQDQPTPSRVGSQLVSTAGSQFAPQSILTCSKESNVFREQPKSVRFNLEQPPSPALHNTEATIEKPTFMGYDFPKPAHPVGSLGEHENPFDIFSFGNVSGRFNYNNEQEQPSSLNCSLNLSSIASEDETRCGMELNNSGNENNNPDDNPFGNGGPGIGSTGRFFCFQ